MNKKSILKYVWAIPVIGYLATIENPALSFNVLLVGCVVALVITIILGE